MQNLGVQPVCSRNQKAEQTEDLSAVDEARMRFLKPARVINRAAGGTASDLCGHLCAALLGTMARRAARHGRALAMPCTSIMGSFRRHRV